MTRSRPAETVKQPASANRKQLDDATQALMASRKAVDGYRNSRLNSDLLFAKNEVTLHVAGNTHVRAIFIEHYDRSFETYSIDILQDIKDNIALEDIESPFRHEMLTLIEARFRFLQMGFHYFSYCITRSNLSSVTKTMTHDDFVPFNEADSTIASAISNVAFPANTTTELFLFDQEKAAGINPKKTKYDVWLEEWNKVNILNFNTVIDDDARKALQMLQHYLGGGKAKRFIFGNWHHHYCNEINAVLAPYRKLKPFDNEPPIDEIEISLTRSDSTSSVDQLLSGKSELISPNTDAAFASVDDILRALKLKIENGKHPILNAHGDSHALMQVIKDYTDVDYFALGQNNELVLKDSPRF